jgi:hypothetical protein
VNRDPKAVEPINKAQGGDPGQLKIFNELIDRVNALIAQAGPFGAGPGGSSTLVNAQVTIIGDDGSVTLNEVAIPGAIVGPLVTS